MKNIEIELLTESEIKAVFGGISKSKKYNLPKPETHEEAISNSQERSMPFSDPINGNMKPNNSTALDEYIKTQQEHLGVKK